MSDTKHTPGRWSAQTGRIPPSRMGGETAWFEITAEGDIGPEVICNRASMRRPAEVEANARLIAAAPEFFDLAVQLIDHWEEDENADHLMHKLRDLVAKARGGAG